MRFDAYGATVPGVKMSYLAHLVADNLNAIAANGPPMRRYGETVQIQVGERNLAWVGQDKSSGDCYIEGKGETTPDLVKVIREHYPVHSAPRIDVCEDYNHPGAFGQLQAIVRGNKGERVKGGYVALPDDEQDGKTWSAGVRGGVGYIRVYEAGKHPDRLHLAKPDWVRAELEARPHYARDKAAAATMQPLQVWGLTAWTQRVGQALTQSEIERFMPEVREYSHGKTVTYIAMTYRRCLEEMVRNGEDITRTFQSVWQEQDSYRRR